MKDKNSLLFLLRLFPFWISRHIFKNSHTRPHFLSLAVTYGCQSHCLTCQIWEIYAKDIEKRKKELTFKDYLPLFSSLKNDLYFLNITGGEPFLRPDLDRLIGLAVQSLPKLSFISIATNGLNPGEILSKIRKILRLYKGNLSLEISLDGDQSLNDQIRGVNGAYKRVLETYRRLNVLAKTNPRFKVFFSYTISKYNCGLFPEFFQKINQELKIGIEKFSINFEQAGLLYHNQKVSARDKKIKDNIKKDLDFILAKNKLKLTPDLLQTGKIIFQRFYIRNLLRFVENPHKMILPCSAAAAAFFIDPYGDIYPCITWDRKLGNIKALNFSKFWGSLPVKEVQREIKKSRCPICFTPCEAQIDFISSLPALVLKPKKFFG